MLYTHLTLNKNIRTAWRVTGLVPYNPAIVLQKLANKQPVADNSTTQSTTTLSPRSTSGDVTIPKITVSFCPGTPKIHHTSPDGAAMFVENTPANFNQVNRLVERMCEKSNLDESQSQVLHKLVKGAKFALADSVLLRITNQELLQANTRKNRRANRTGNHYGGEARVLSLKDVRQRQQWAINKENEQKERKQAAEMRRLEIEFSKAFKDLGRLGPDLLGDVPKQSRSPRKSSSPQKSSSSSNLLASPQKQLIPVLVPSERVEKMDDNLMKGKSEGKSKERTEEVAGAGGPGRKGKAKAKEVDNNLLRGKSKVNSKGKGKEMAEEVIDEAIQTEEGVNVLAEGSSKAVNNEGLIRISRSGRMIKPAKKM